jgi:hypothetical protein
LVRINFHEFDTPPSDVTFSIPRGIALEKFTIGALNTNTSFVFDKGFLKKITVPSRADFTSVRKELHNRGKPVLVRVNRAELEDI